ncbi:MAG: hypothetical protein ACYSU0_03555 [Planctomycetota bacterium]
MRRGSRDLYAPAAILAAALSAGCEPVAVGPVPAPRTQDPPKVVAKEEPKEMRPEEESLEEAIDSALRLLIGRHFEDYLDRFMHPHRKQNVLRHRTLQQLAKVFTENEDFTSAMIDRFKYARSAAPETSEDGLTATWRWGQGKRLTELVLVRIDGRWYVD